MGPKLFLHFWQFTLIKKDCTIELKIKNYTNDSIKNIIIENSFQIFDNGFFTII